MLSLTPPAVVINKEPDIQYRVTEVTASMLPPNAEESIVFCVEHHQRIDNMVYGDPSICLLLDEMAVIAEHEVYRMNQVLTQHVQKVFPDWEFPDYYTHAKLFIAGVERALELLSTNQLRFLNGEGIVDPSGTLLKHLYGLVRMKTGAYGMLSCTLINTRTPTGEQQDAFRIVHHLNSVDVYA